MSAFQYAALPYRRTDDGVLEIMLVTSRSTRRWVIPKGWPIRGLPPHKSAAREAMEEAGLLGQIGKKAVGRFSYDKRLKDGSTVECEVTVFALEVERQLGSWPEMKDRRNRWFSVEEAAQEVQEPALRAIILNAHQLAYETQQPAALG